MDEFEPVFGIGIFVALATVEDEQVKAALGEKELVGGVHDLLPTEVPHVECNIFGVVKVNGPLSNLDAFGFSRLWIKFFMD